jgi:hypothetical protein
VILDQVCNAMGDDASLARSGAGQDQHRPVYVLDGFLLLRIEFTEVQPLSLREE